MKSGHREKAKKCRALLRRAAMPEIRQQLRIWARDFDEMAERQEQLQRLRLWRNRMRKAFRPVTA